MKIGQGVMPFIAEAIVEIGVRVIQFAVAVFILAINVPIFIYIKKEAAVLMLIINNTDEDMGLDEIVATHGKVVGVFRADKQEENPRLLIPKRLPPVPQQSDQAGIFAGFFVARKNDKALIVTQGAMKFEKTKTYPDGVYIGWEVRLRVGNNRVLVSATFTDGAGKFSEKTNNEDKQSDSSKSSQGGMVFANINDKSRSRAHMITSIGPVAS